MKLLSNLKKCGVFLALLSVCFVFFTACVRKESQELLVFAGAGLRLPLNEIGKNFEQKYGARVVFSFAGSGRLGNRILTGQSPDIFIPGSERWAKILQEKDYLKEYTLIAYHTPVIITPKGNNKVNSLKDFTGRKNRIVLGDPRAAAIGEASAAIFKKAGLKESEMKVVSRGATVTQLVLWIKENHADAAIVWETNAVQSGKVRLVDIPEQYNLSVPIPVCLLVNRAAAVQFVRYLDSEESKEIFKRYGFGVVK